MSTPPDAIVVIVPANIGGNTDPPYGQHNYPWPPPYPGVYVTATPLPGYELDHFDVNGVTHTENPVLVQLTAGMTYVVHVYWQEILSPGSIEVHAWVGGQEVTANAEITKGIIAGEVAGVGSLDGNYSHDTPWTFTNLSNGYWFLEVRYQDQPVQTKGFDISNNSFREDFYFAPSNEGTLTILAYLDNGDVGAAITIDGVPGSWTTGVVLTLEAGTYTVHAHFLEYPDITETATVYANQNMDLSFYWYTVPVPCMLTVTAGNGGDTDANGTNYLYQGDSITVTATPRQGFEFDYWTLDGVNVDGSSTYLFVQVDQQNHVLEAAFKTETPPPPPPPPPDGFDWAWLAVPFAIAGACAAAYYLWQR